MTKRHESKNRGDWSLGWLLNLSVSHILTTQSTRLVKATALSEANKRRDANHEWQVIRRECTRKLIELGGLVMKTGLAELTDDDRAKLYGAILTVVAKLRSEDRERALVLWKRKGKRACLGCEAFVG